MKARRHQAITDILTNEYITTQEQLCSALKERGFNVTQATVSRDIKELQLVKKAVEKGYRYALPDIQTPTNLSERLKRLFRDSVLNIDYCENLIVIKTLPGAAQSVALVVDSMPDSNILGTVAGDDTLFIAIKPREAVTTVFNSFKELLMEH
ncbi:MAG: arginine repressor [Syntrophomonadaceae bacterium]|jgi:transcriptional regulator of arginine metabolism